MIAANYSSERIMVRGRILAMMMMTMRLIMAMMIVILRMMTKIGSRNQTR